MVFLYILAAILLLLLILLLFPLWIKINIETEKEAEVSAGFLFISFPLLKEKRENKRQIKPAQIKQTKTAPKKKEKKDFSETLGLIKIILSEILKTTKRIKISRLSVFLSVASDDAAKTAILSGEYNALVYSFLSFLKNFFSFGKEKINIRPDFSGEKTRYKINLKICIGGVFVLIFALRIIKRLLTEQTNERKEENENASD